MSAVTRNRELSQLGSFVYVDDATKSVAITTGSSYFVGIGSTLPSKKLDVFGDINITGELYQNNLPFTVSGISSTSNLKTSGIITASAFYVNDIPLVNPELSPWTIGTGSSIYRLLGNVGFGTTNPQYKMDVIGDINFTGTLRQNGAEFVTSKWTSTTGSNIYRISGNVGIGTSVFTEKLTVNGNVSAGQFISTVTAGTAPLVVLSDTQVTNLNASFLRGKVPPSGTIVGTTDTQTLTNKTLTSPVISSISNTGTITLPTSTTTLVGRDTTDTLTNKTIAAGSNTISGLTNTNLSGSAGITNANLANSTISGVSLGSNLASLSFNNYITVSGSYNGSTARTVSIAGTSVNTSNTLVARDINGNFTAGSINCSSLTATFSVEAADFNSTSDLDLKTNVNTIENSLDLVNSLRGVSFDWKINGKKSYGVIAQELEQVLPDLVTTKENKSVNYNGLVGVLLQAIKELSAEVEELKKKVS